MPFIVPIITAIGGAIGSFGTFLAGLGLFGKVLIGIGINVVSALLQRQRAKNQRQVGGVQIERQYGGNVPRQVAIGLVGIAGHDCYVNTYGSDNKFLQQVYTLSDYYIDGMSRLAINGKYVEIGETADPDKGFPVTSGDFANLIWIKIYDGWQTTADDYLIANANPSDRWSEDHKGIGVAFAVISMTYDREKNASFPDFFFEFRGAPLYDWRKDSTVGGSGTHRRGDPTTHEYSENPIVTEYNYRRGFSINNDLFCGMQMEFNELPLDKWTPAANLCDEVDSTDGETRYRLSLLLDCTATHKENIEAIALSCGSMNVDGVGGSWPIVGSEQPVVMTFTDDDLIATARVRYRAKRSMSQLVNSVSGTYPDPDQLWSMVGYETQIATAHLAIDRRTRDIAMSFPQVRHARQAEQLAHIYLYENRFEITATVTLRPRYRVLEVGDWISWNSARYGTHTFIVQSKELTSLEDEQGPRNVIIGLQERSGEIYDGVTPSVPVVPTPPGQPVYLEQVQNFQLAPVIVLGDTGAEQAAIRASWNTITDSTVDSVIVQYWPVSDPTNIVTKIVPFDQTVIILTEGVVSSTEYAVRTKLIVNMARAVMWSPTSLVTTPDVTPDFFPIDLEDLGEDVRDYHIWVGNGYREILLNLQELDLRIANQEFGSRYERNVMRNQVTASIDGARAEWTQQIDVVATETAALAQDVTTLNAQLLALNGTVAGQATAIFAMQTQVSVINDEVIAMATAITSLSASSTPGETNEANFRMQIVTGPSGYSRIGAQTRIGGTGGWRGAAWFLDTPNNTNLPTRFVVDAQQFVILDTSSEVTTTPFLWQGGIAYMENARIGNVIFDRLNSADGKMEIRGMNGTFIRVRV